jgi:hypothetical protein
MKSKSKNITEQPFSLRITSVLEHGQLCSSQPKPKAQDATSYAAIHTAVSNNKSISAKALIGTALSEGIDLSQSKAYRVKRMIRHEDDHLFPQSFQLIKPYLEETARLNQGTTWDFQVRMHSTLTSHNSTRAQHCHLSQQYSSTALSPVTTVLEHSTLTNHDNTQAQHRVKVSPQCSGCGRRQQLPASIPGSGLHQGAPEKR